MDIAHLIQIAKGEVREKSLSREIAIKKLGAINQRDSIEGLVRLLENTAVAKAACSELAQTVYLFDAYYQVENLYQQGNVWAAQLMKCWAEEVCLNKKQALPKSIHAIVFKVPGCTTVEMISPMSSAFTRSDIALHAQSLLARIIPNTVSEISRLKALGYPVVFVADRIDTTNASLQHCYAAVQALLWHIGVIGNNPHQVSRGIVLSSQIDQRFYDIAESFGALLLTLATNQLRTGDVLHIHPYQAMVQLNDKSFSFTTKRDHWQSIWRMGNRTAFMLGKALARKAKANLENTSCRRSSVVHGIAPVVDVSPKYTLAQKMIGSACGTEGVTVQTVCEPIVDTVVLPSLEVPLHQSVNYSSLGHFAELVLKNEQAKTDSQNELVLKPNEGSLHAWLSRLLIPDQIHFSGDTYTRYPLGLTLSSYVTEINWAALTSLAPMTMAESVLIRFYGKKRAEIRLRDLINAIPYFALNKLSASRSDNLFVGRIVEIQGVDFLTVEEAYEFTEDSVSYQSVACTIELAENNVLAAVANNKQWLAQLINDKHPQNLALQRRLYKLNDWLQHPYLLKADAGANYAKTINISLENLKEPLLASIENLKLVISLSEAAGKKEIINTVWIGSSAICLDHYRVVARLLQKYSGSLKARLWIAPPSAIELKQLMQEGCYKVYGRAGVYTQMPDNVFCAETYFQPGSKVVATSKRFLLNKVKQGWHGYIASPELATITALLGRLPSLYEYQTMLLE